MEGAVNFRKKLKKGQVCFGAGISLNDPLITETLCDYVDFVWIDCEHNLMPPNIIYGHLLAARSKGVCSIVRVAGSETYLIKPVIDSGANGIIIPQIKSAKEVKKIIDDCRYTPLGHRGFGGSSTYNYNSEKIRESLDYANENLFVSVQIENMEALKDLDNILTVRGLDSVVIGPYDLSGALGMLGDVENPKVFETIKSIVNKSKEAGVYIGSATGQPDPEYSYKMIKCGIQWFQICNDYSLLKSGMDWIKSNIRSLISKNMPSIL